MDATPPIDDDGPEDEAARVQRWRQLAEQLARYQQSLCRRCKGTGMCDECDGHGRYYVRGLGFFDCTVCIGDGACIICKGTGQVPHA